MASSSPVPPQTEAAITEEDPNICTANLVCPSGSTIWCEGDLTCEVRADHFYIICDDSATYCPCYGSVCGNGYFPECRCICIAAGGTLCWKSCRAEC
jgi:hypothetical protein